MSDSLIKSLKDGARVVILGLVSYLLADGVIGGLIAAIWGIDLNPVVVIFLTGAFTSILKAIDRFLHESSDSGTGFLAEKGLTNF